MNTIVHTTKFRIIGPILVFAFVEFFFRLVWYVASPLETILKNDLIMLTAAIISWQVARWTVLSIQQRFPGLVHARKRLLLLLALMPVLGNFAWILAHSVWFITDGHFLYFDSVVDYCRTLGIQLFCHIIYYAIYEGSYSFREWKRDYIEKDELEKINLQSQLTSLQHQVNPHFLFNSLNSLSSLISESPAQAEEFVEELSSVYRYLLRDNAQNLTTLAAELAFIRSYYLLLKTRHGNGLTLQVNVAQELQSYQMPPLTMQLLIENAVKHNVVFPEQPLRITIETNALQQLVISNNLQRRKVRVASNGVGLSNIMAKYEMLGQKRPMVQDDGERFIVTLPLI
ncbi:sensor histidine kinase [Runella sp.]|uniref:sensor histidine kinase n=1 Tax=Runella sp. TaxID=1960881 RepID=UPI003D0F734F